MSPQALTVLLLGAVSVPVVAFWVERALENQVWYMRDPGIIGALAPSWFALPIIFMAQLIIIIAGWKSLEGRYFFIAMLLVFAPIPALLLPFLLAFAFQP